MKNSDIKKTIKESRILQYEIAAQMGISEYTLCKWFRKELTAEQQERILAAIADASGVEIEEAPAKDNRKCPFSIYGHCEGCALYNKGCAVVRLAASTINK